jgi:O-Antigen ligase
LSVVVATRSRPVRFASAHRSFPIAGWPPAALVAAGFAVVVPLLNMAALPMSGWSSRFVLLPVAAAAGISLLFRLRRSPLRLVAVVGLAWLVWGMLCVAFSSVPALAFWGAWDFGTGGLFMLAVAGLWAVGAWSGDRGAILVERALIVGGLVNALIAVVSAGVDLSGLGLSGPGVQQGGLWGNAAVLAAFLLGVLWLLAPYIRTGPRRYGALVVVVAAGLQVSGERAALAVVLVVLAASFRRIGRRSGLIFVSLVLVGMLGGLGVAHVSSAPSAVSRATSSSEGMGPRFENWMSAAHAVAHRPIFGEGPGRYAAAADPLRTLALVRARGSDVYYTDAHDIIVEYAVTTGIPGVVLFVAWAAVAFWAARRRASLVGFAGAVLAVQLLQPQNVGLTPLAFLALGAAAAPELRLRGSVGASILHGMVVVAGAAVAVVLFIGFFQYQRMVDGRRLSVAASARSLLPPWPDVTIEYGRTVFLNDTALGKDPRARFADWGSWDLTAIKQDPKSPSSYYDAGQTEYLAGQFALASAVLHKGITLDPWSSDISNSLGYVATAQHQPRDAIGWFQRSLRATPDQPDIQRQLNVLLGMPTPAPTGSDRIVINP